MSNLKFSKKASRVNPQNTIAKKLGFYFTKRNFIVLECAPNQHFWMHVIYSTV